MILLATYWNEAEWVDLSLEQIERINPEEIIICDGCFDSSVPNTSTDGTREKLEYFVRENKSRAKLVSAIRLPGNRAFFNMMSGLGPGQSMRFLPSRLLYSLKHSLKTHEYRINQALTFNYMASLAGAWRPGGWFMTYDADQFYSDELIEMFSVCNGESEYGYISAQELTFPEGFNEFTDCYEVRTWNNMPHKIYNDTAIYPTRNLVREGFLYSRLYCTSEKALEGGYYCHYKFRGDAGRREAGYSLGDRMPPEISRLSSVRQFDLEHPKVIREYLR